MSVSVVFPVYLPSEEHRKMTDKNLYVAKSSTDVPLEWVIVETCSEYYKDEADIYIHEEVKTTPNKSINRAFFCADGDFVIFLGNDVTVCDGWVEKMLDCFEQYSDCGIASLGNNEHKDNIEEKIIEDLYFSVCMLRKPDAWMDSKYNYIFDDTDLIFRLYTQGKRFYKNLRGHINHKAHSTYGKFCGNQDEYNSSLEYFRNKWKDYDNDSFYRKLSGMVGTTAAIITK